MDKIEGSFIGFLLSLKNIGLTLIMSFIIISYYCTLIFNYEAFFISDIWIAIVSGFVTTIYIGFLRLSYIAWKDKTESIRQK